MGYIPDHTRTRFGSLLFISCIHRLRGTLGAYVIAPWFVLIMQSERLFDSVVPFVASGIAIWAIAASPITEERAHEVRLELEARRGAA